jgi:hypothetical protein
MLVADGRKWDVGELFMVLLALGPMPCHERLNPARGVLKAGGSKCSHRLNGSAPRHARDVDQLGVRIAVRVVSLIPESKKDVGFANRPLRTRVKDVIEHLWLPDGAEWLTMFDPVN